MSAQQRFDLIRTIGSGVVNLFNKKNSPCTAPCDGWILKMHYRWCMWIFIGCFSAIAYSWHNRDVITCVSTYNAELAIKLDYLNICLSYPFVWQENGTKRYLLFYRWTHWSCLILAAIYYIPRRLSKTYENPKIKKLFEDLAMNQDHYDQRETFLVDSTARYLVLNLKTHNGLFIKYFVCNLVALTVDVLSFLFLNFLFQGRFLTYGITAYPFYRDPKKFTDPMSQTFPPFAKCIIHKNNQLLDNRIEQYGCHLTVMELYEKVFLFLWFWLITLIALTVVYLIFLLTLNIRFVRLHALRIAKPIEANSSIRNTVCSVIESCQIGDIYLLYRLRQFFSHAKFYEVLRKITDQTYRNVTLNGVTVDSNIQNAENANVRQRIVNMQQMQKAPKKMQKMQNMQMQHAMNLNI